MHIRSPNIYQIHQPFCVEASIGMYIKNEHIYSFKIVTVIGLTQIYRLAENSVVETVLHINAQ